MSQPKLTDEEILQGISDAMGAVIIALGEQLDAVRLYATLQALANQADRAGRGPSAGLIDELALVVQKNLLKRKGEH